METLNIFALRERLREAEADARKAAEQLRVAQERAEFAEKAARDAWAFARGLMQSRRPGIT